MILGTSFIAVNIIVAAQAPDRLLADMAMAKSDRKAGDTTGSWVTGGLVSMNIAQGSTQNTGPVTFRRRPFNQIITFVLLFNQNQPAFTMGFLALVATLKWVFLILAIGWSILKYLHKDMYVIRGGERITYKWIFGYREKDIHASPSDAWRKFMRASNAFSFVLLFLTIITVLLFLFARY